MKNQKSVLIAFTGGLKSTVAAYLLIKQGYKVMACSFLMGEYGSSCTLKNSDRAGEICKQLEINHSTLDLSSEYYEMVISPLVGAKVSGEASYPCFNCNILKMEKLLKHANDNKIDFIATGHLANLVKEPSGFKLLQGIEEEYDQSFFISGIREPILEKLLLPLGKLTLNEIEKISKSLNLQLEVKSSRTICLDDLNQIIPIVEREVPLSLRSGGLIIDRETGMTLGQHNGFYNFKLGMKNLDTWNLEPSNNLLVVGFDDKKKIVLVSENARFVQEQLEVNLFNSFLDIDQTGPLKCLLALEPGAKKILCVVFLGNNGHATIQMENPVDVPIEIGKLIVFYENSFGNVRLIATGFVSKLGPFPENSQEEGNYIN